MVGYFLWYQLLFNDAIISGDFLTLISLENAMDFFILSC